METVEEYSFDRKRWVVGGLLEPPESLSETAGRPLTKRTSSPLLLGGAKLFISLMSLVTTNCPASVWSFVPIDADRINLCDVKYRDWGKKTKTGGAESIKPEGAVWFELEDEEVMNNRSVENPHLQSIFSTRYAHIRKPVLLKPCVQWTPSGRKRQKH